MSKIFVRERRHVGEGAGRPRFAIIAAQGVDLHVYMTRVRRAELEKIAAETDAQIIYLPRGEQAEDVSVTGKGGGRRRQRRQPAADE